MSLLDKLKKEAEATRATRTGDGGGTHPETPAALEKLRDLHAYFREMSEQLSVIDPDIRVDYDLPGFGTLRALRQGGYGVATDQPENMRRFHFRMVCSKPGAVKMKPVSGPLIARRAELLRGFDLKFRPQNNPDGSVSFVVDARVPGGVRVEVDEQRGKLRLRLRNIEGLGAANHLFEPARIDGEFNDELGKYLLRQPNRFDEISGNVLTHTFRAKLRDQVVREKTAREREVAETGVGERTAGSRFGRTLFGARG